MDESNQNQTQKSGRRRSKPIPTELRGFNMDAFLLSYYWAYKNGFKTLSFMLAIPFVLFFLNAVYIDLTGSSELLGSAVPLGLVITTMAILIGVAGNFIVWRAGEFDDLQAFHESQKMFTKPGLAARFWGIHFVVPLLLLFFMLFAVGPRRANRMQDVYLFSCRSQLQNMQAAAQDYIFEGKSLNELSANAEELCQYIYVGAVDSADCADMFIAKFNHLCDAGSFRLKIPEHGRFEFRAVARDKKKTKICATETAVLPNENHPEENRFNCNHSGDSLTSGRAASRNAVSATGTLPLSPAGNPEH